VDLAENIRAQKSEYISFEDKVTHFNNYIKNQTLKIAIYDSDSGFLFGLAKLPMNNLSLKNQEGPTALIQKALEVDVCDPSSGSTLGHL
jgi:hypothetical protein